MSRLSPFSYLVIGALLTVLAYTAVHAYKWKKVADRRGWQAEQAYGYLAEPVLQLPDGRVLTRAQVLDALIGQAVQKK